MTVAAATLERLAAGASALLEGSGASIVSVESNNPAGMDILHQMLVDAMRRDLGTGIQPISIVIDGWGRSLEAQRTKILAGVDAAGSRGSVAQALAHPVIASHLQGQADLRRIAATAGIERPLTGDGLYETSHLLCDAAAMRVFIDAAGSREAARVLLDLEMSRHAHVRGNLYRPDRTFRHPDTRIAGRRIILPIEFTDDGRTHYGHDSNDDGASTLIIWEDGELTVTTSTSIPDTVQTALPGRTVGELASGTPIGERRILEVPERHNTIYAGTTLRIETDDILVDEVLGPQGPRTPMSN